MTTRYLFQVCAALAVTLGCSSVSPIRTTPSVGVTQIPSKMAVYPLLSAKSARAGGSGSISTLYSGSSHTSRGELYVAPPAETELSLTALSQVLTGELSVQMAAYGFSLRELPYEVKKSLRSEDGDSFVLSLAALDELREKSGLEAIVVGNAFFQTLPYNEKRVEAAYLRVIDTETLEVLCQVSMPPGQAGRELGEVADIMASQLAALAGLSVGANGPSN